MIKLTEHGIVANGGADESRIQELIDNAGLGETIYFDSVNNNHYGLLNSLVLRRSIRIVGDSTNTILRQAGQDPVFSIIPSEDNQIFIIENLTLVSGTIGIDVSSSNLLHPTSKINNLSIESPSETCIKYEGSQVNFSIENSRLLSSSYGVYVNTDTDYNNLCMDKLLIEGMDSSSIFLSRSSSGIKQGSFCLRHSIITGSQIGLQLSNVQLDGDFVNFSGVSTEVSLSGTSIFSDSENDSTRILRVSSSVALIARNNYTILCDAVSGTLSASLFDASIQDGATLNIKKTDSTVNIVTIMPSGSQLIDGSANKQISVQYTSVSIVASDGNWWII